MECHDSGSEIITGGLQAVVATFSVVAHSVFRRVEGKAKCDRGEPAGRSRKAVCTEHQHLPIQGEKQVFIIGTIQFIGVGASPPPHGT